MLWLALAATLACGPAADEVVELRIGVIAPLSGPLYDEVGRSAREGANLAVELAGGREGFAAGGRRIRPVLLFEDSLDRPETAVHAARKLISRDRVTALVGPMLSRNALAAAAVAEGQRIPRISPTATYAELTTGRRYVFRTTFVNEQQGSAAARFAHQDLGERRQGRPIHRPASTRCR